MNKYDIWFACTEISNFEKINLIKAFKNTENLWYHIINKRHQDLIDVRIAGKLVGSWDGERINSIQTKISGIGSGYVTYFDDRYPEKLKNIEDPPFNLFYYGDLEKLNPNPCVAIVGSRDCSPYGINVTKFITKDLSANNISVISGMAKGIDSIAHKTSLDNGGFTCAVLGSGIDVIYPKENTLLYKKLLEKGCVISEFVPGTRPFAYNFPLRNRIISALSTVIVIVEAGLKSGSLITASRALEQGKEVISVPGSIFSEQSKGTNKLIVDGAYPFTCMDDIYDILGIKCIKQLHKTYAVNNEYESKVCRVLSDNPIHIDDIIRMVDIDIKRLYELLFEMQVKDEIMCLAGNYYVKVNNNV
jgi:DNA processing protein